MKIKPTRTLFYFVTALIAILPVGRHLDLFLFGGKTEGVVTHRNHDYIHSLNMGSGSITYSEFEFNVDGYTYAIEGPSNIDYKIGEKCKIIYQKKNPWKCIIPSFHYLYLSSNAAFSASLLIIWVAFYTSFFGLKKQARISKTDKIEKTNNMC